VRLNNGNICSIGVKSASAILGKICVELISIGLTISRDKCHVTSPNIPLSQAMPHRPLALPSLPDRSEIMEISVQSLSNKPTQNWEKFALNINGLNVTISRD